MTESTNTNTPVVLSIVVTYNGEKWITKCLESLQQSTFQTGIVVVDNHSTDNTCEIIAENYPKVNLIKNPVNLGFGKANNIGFELALAQNADYVFLLNQDAWIDENTMERLIEAHQKNQSFGIISPIHLNANRQIDRNFRTFLNESSSLGAIPENLLNANITLIEVPFVNAAAWLVSSSCLKKVGGFMPLFYHYGEDNNYCERVIKKGFKVGCYLETTIIHDRHTRAKVPSPGKILYRLYVELLVIFAYPSIYHNEYRKHLLKSLFRFMKRNYYRFDKLILVPVALLRILSEWSEISRQRKISCLNERPFLR